MISTKGRYALRLMVDLGVNGGEDKYISLKDISARQNISIKYLEQIVTLLHRAGYVRSIRGAQGGYMLTMPPENYTVGMILRQTEGSLSPVSCLDKDAPPCERAGQCVTLSVWQKIKDAVDQVVDHVTLADLIEEQRCHPNDNLL